jgi:hypothetical protein
LEIGGERVNSGTWREFRHLIFERHEETVPALTVLRNVFQFFSYCLAFEKKSVACTVTFLT